MKTIKYIVLVVAVLTFHSCNDYLREVPEDMMTADMLYVSAAGFQTGLNGLYSLMRAERQGLANNFPYELGASFYVGYDDISSGSGSGSHPVNVVVNSSTARHNTPSNGHLANLFEWLYSTINAANTIITRAERDGIDWMANGQNQKARVVGEAHLARAWAYRLLVACWGDVPLKLDESTGTNIRNDFERAPEQEVYAQMKEDLLIAAQNIPWKPYLSGSPTKGVALHYLAETCLALNEPDQAERYLNILIGNGTINGADIQTYGSTDRSLITGYPNAYNDMFEPSKVDWNVNSETLWTWQWALNTVGGGASARRFTMVARFAGSAYTQGSLNTTPYFERENIAIMSSDERGGMGWGASAILQRVFKLYYRSSQDCDTGNPDPPYPVGSTTAENVNYWKNFRYEDRGNERALRKFFLYDPATDTRAKVDASTGDYFVNPNTGAQWKLGDTIYMTARGSSPPLGIFVNGMGIDYRNYSRNANTMPYPIKYSYTNQGYHYRLYSNLNQIYLRLGESYLLRAEARAKRGDLTGATDDINVIRTRARAKTISIIPGSTLQDQLDYILDERSRELLGEEQRRVTLARMGRYDFLYRRVQMYNQQDAPNIRKEDVFFAIPQSVIDANLTKPFPQNPGWGGVPVNQSLYPLIEFPWSVSLADPDMY